MDEKSGYLVKIGKNVHVREHKLSDGTSIGSILGYHAIILDRYQYTIEPHPVMPKWVCITGVIFDEEADATLFKGWLISK